MDSSTLEVGLTDAGRLDSLLSFSGSPLVEASGQLVSNYLALRKCRLLSLAYLFIIIVN